MSSIQQPYAPTAIRAPIRSEVLARERRALLQARWEVNDESGLPTGNLELVIHANGESHPVILTIDVEDFDIFATECSQLAEALREHFDGVGGEVPPARGSTE